MIRTGKILADETRRTEFSAQPTWRQIAVFAAIGVAAGLASGMFGVGGGTIVVPALIGLAQFQPRMAAGTSLAAIIPIASVGVFSYALNGSVSWLAALLIASGAMVGARFGTKLMARTPQRPLQIAFSFFMVLAVISLFLVFPSREAVLEITVWSGIALVVLGLVTGLLAGLLGVGGGLIVVPALMLFFGASDLVAKGTSLLMMIPSALVGTYSNFQRGNVDLKAGLIIGVAASVTTFLGGQLAAVISPRLANILFAIFLAILAVRLFVTAAFPKKK